MQLLKRSEDIAGNAELQAMYDQLLSDIRRHSELVEQRLESLGDKSSALKDNALGMGGLNWGLFFQAQSDTPAKLAAFVYAVLHLEIGGYELLQRTAARAGDADTQRLCTNILADKRAMADRLAATFDSAVKATLAALEK